MSKRRVMLVLALVIGAVAAVPVVALAWPGGDRGGGNLLIGFELHFVGETSTAGTFVASGDVDDAGTSTVSDLAVEPFGHRDRGRLSGRQEFAGARGTIVTEFEGVASDISEPHQSGAGRFRIVSGTGDYAGARGGGRFTIVVDAVGNHLIGTEEGRVRSR